MLLLASSAAIYSLQVRIFDRGGETLFYLLQDLAFLPVQVLLVTLIINDLMARRERQALLRKMNMVIGAFYSEYGYELIKALSAFQINLLELQALLKLETGWGSIQFAAAQRSLAAFQYKVDSRAGDLDALKTLLADNKTFLLELLGNQNLLEHQSFTDLLWALSHLTEELQFRGSLQGLPKADMDHLSQDIKRAYALLVAEWLSYAGHLRQTYPYIYSLVVRTNPFDPASSAVVQ